MTQHTINPPDLLTARHELLLAQGPDQDGATKRLVAVIEGDALSFAVYRDGRLIATFRRLAQGIRAYNEL